MRIIRPCLIALAVMLWATSVWAYDYLLTEKDLSKLTPEAQGEYKKAMHELDHVLLNKALESLQAAQKSDPANARIRLLVAEVAISEARKNMGEDAINLFRIAETAYSEVVEAPEESVRQSEREVAQTGLEQVRNFIIKQAERDARRIKVGKDIIKERAAELYPEKEEEPEELTPAAAQAAQNAQGQAGRAPAAAAGMMMNPAMMGMY